jgi:eukaryotic-like serine/threonine-protein kinase
MPADDRLEALLNAWHDARARGSDVPAADLCRDHPDLLPAVEEKLAALRWMAALGEQTADGATVDHPDSSPPSAAGPADAPPGYEILGELGRGGMGVVYRARQQGTNREVALKMVLAGGHASDRDRERFRQEAEAVARVRHPHIVQVFHVGEHRGIPFFALEYCPGGNLAAAIRDRTWAPVAAARVVETLARAIQAAHDAGVIHRDIKPGNVLLAGPLDPTTLAVSDTTVAPATPPVKLTDFGLAKLVDETAMTTSGAVMGTPSYMSPEQAAGSTRDVGPATDVYALGAILYELLTGRPPFRADTPVQTIREVIEKDPVRPSRLNALATGPLEAICLKCLEKEPWRRYPSAAALADDLGQFVAGRRVVARRAGQFRRTWVWCRRNPIVAGLLAAVAVSLVAGTVAASVFAVRAVDQAKRADERAEAAEKAEKEASAAKQAAEAELARAEGLLYSADLDAAQREWLNRNTVEALAALRRTRWDLRGWEYDFVASQFARGQTVWYGHSREVTALAVHPSGKTVASASGDRVLLREAVTGQVLRAFDAVESGFLEALAFHPTADRLAVADSEKVWVWDSTTGRELQAFDLGGRPLSSLAWLADGRLTAEPVRGGRRAFAVPHVSPDGTREAKVHRNDAGFQTDVHEVATGRAAWKTAGRWPTFSPDGMRVAVVRDSEVRIHAAADGARLATCTGHLQNVLGVAFRPDGTGLLTAGHDGTIRLWDTATGAALQAWHGHTDSVTTLAWGPDGQWFISGGRDPTVRRWAVGGGQEPLRVTIPGGLRRWLALAPDGRRLATITDRELRLWDADTGRSLAALGVDGPDFLSAVFTPDGRHLITSAGDPKPADQRGVARLLLRDAGTLAVVRAFPATASQRAVAVSPDGRWLATAAITSTVAADADQVSVWDMATGRLDRTLPGGVGWVEVLAFSPDGSWLVVGGDNGMTVYESATGRVVAGFPTGVRVSSLAIAPDGSWITTNGESAVILWDVPTGRKRFTLPAETADAWGLAVTPDGRRLLIGTQRHRMVVCDPETGRVLFTTPSSEGGLSRLTLSRGGTRGAGFYRMENDVQVFDARPPGERVLSADHAVFAVTVAPDGRHAVTVGSSGTPRVWDLTTGRPGVAGPAHGDSTSAVAVGPDGTTVASAGEDMVVRVWDAATGAVRRELIGHRGPVVGLAWLSGGQLASAGGVWDAAKENVVATEVFVWDPATGEQVRRWDADPADVKEFAVAPDGRTLATAAADGMVRLWDADTGRLAREWKADPSAALAVRFSPDGSRVAAGGETGAAVWRTDTGTKVFDLTGHRGPVYAVAFTPAGDRLVTGGDDHSVRFWDAAGRPLGTRWGHTDAVIGLAVTPDGRAVLSASNQRLVRVWDWPRE